MRQKRVSGGQKIGGNLSAKAISELPRLIENDQMRELNKPGGPIPYVDGPGLFVYGAADDTLEPGEWTYLNRPLFPSTVISTDVKEATWFQQTEIKEAATPTGLGVDGPSQYVKNLLPAMAVEGKPSGAMAKFQIGGLARTRIQFPEGGGESNRMYRTAVIGSNNHVPIATKDDNGEMDIIWHKEIDAENRIHAALVRFPSVPRPPRTAQYNFLCNDVTYNGGFKNANGSDGVIVSGANTYHGTQAASANEVQLLRSGDYLVSANLYFSSYSWTARSIRTGKVIAEVIGPGTLGTLRLWGNIKTADEVGEPFYDRVFASATRTFQIQAGETLSVRASADIGTADVGVQLSIMGPFNNHFPEGSIYV